MLSKVNIHESLPNDFRLTMNKKGGQAKSKRAKPVTSGSKQQEIIHLDSGDDEPVSKKKHKVAELREPTKEQLHPKGLFGTTTISKNTVEDEEFRGFVECLDPRAPRPSRGTIEKENEELWESTKANLKIVLSRMKVVAFTVGWLPFASSVQSLE